MSDDVDHILPTAAFLIVQHIPSSILSISQQKQRSAALTVEAPAHIYVVSCYTQRRGRKINVVYTYSLKTPFPIPSSQKKKSDLNPSSSEQKRSFLLYSLNSFPCQQL